MIATIKAAIKCFRTQEKNCLDRAEGSEFPSFDKGQASGFRIAAHYLEDAFEKELKELEEKK